ncbi:MAG: calcium-translocating P-type ATPase, PMCA-type [Bacteroidales bacterium]|nr:calcium-translocating P-type ATPase, PMCA-type [Bacteroidales bacterium]
MTLSDANYKGLSDNEVKQSREKNGNNILTPPKGVSLWKLYLEKYDDPVIKVLLVAAIFSLIVAFIENEYVETIGIIAAILLTTTIGFLFEYDANKKFKVLTLVNEENSIKVIRNSHVIQVPRKDIVVGDIVLLETGDEVPADGVLLEAVSLQINESSLTGEPIVSKTTNPQHFDKEAPYPSNKLYRGTTILSGHCVLEVSEVGDATEIGKVSKLSTATSEEETPLSKQLQKLANLIGKIGFTISIAVFVIFVAKDLYQYLQIHETITWANSPAIIQILLKYFMVSVTLIVVSVPEGLPMSITLSLAINMSRMLKTNNLVRKMHASETMGAITVICTDKTGTLTQNQMTVYEADFFPLGDTTLAEINDDKIKKLIVESISSNTTAYLEENDDSKGLGNPTEVALLLWLNNQGENYLIAREKATPIDQLTFSTERKLMATLVNSTLGKKILYVKGAPEILLSKSNSVLLKEGRKSPNDVKKQLEDQLTGFQNKAMRTLAFAYMEVDEKDTRDCKELLEDNNLELIGITAISDPVRLDVADAVNDCRSAGVDIKIVTGDTQKTTLEIARQIGLWDIQDNDDSIITGTAFEQLSDEEALEQIDKLKIMSRARPTDKQRLVQLLQQKGHVVAVTGDGTNDAPALNFAHVGLSMGSGTTVAKEASDITLLDDSFNSISTAIMWGRSLYKNIQRFIVFQLTINFVAVMIVLIGSIWGTTLPLTVTQMLWVNLIMDTFAALALASIPPTREVMQEKPRKNKDFIITKNMGQNIIGVGTLFLIVLTGLLTYFSKAEGGITPYQLTIFFTFFVMLQFWNLFNTATFYTNHSIFKGLNKNLGLLGVAGLILLGQFLIVQFGGEIFRTVPLTLETWGIIILSSSFILWIGEFIRLIKRLIVK